MDFILKSVPSLQYLARVKLISSFWNQFTIRKLILQSYMQWLKSFNVVTGDKWQNIEKMVIKNMLTLQLPKSIEEEILKLIRPIGEHIVIWMQYHNFYYNLSLGFPDDFSWRPHGGIDKQRTAELLVENENLDILKRYKLACIYCLEDHISTLWKRLTENQKENLFNELDPQTVVAQDRNAHLELVLFWSCEQDPNFIPFTFPELRSNPCYYAFDYSVKNCNIIATEYFWQKVSIDPSNLIDYFIEFVNKNLSPSVDRVPNNRNGYYTEYYNEVLSFFLTTLSPEEMEIWDGMFVDYFIPDEKLSRYLNWPWQSLCVEFIRNYSVFLEDNIGMYLITIIEKIKEGYKDYDYRKLFTDIWQAIPSENKEYIVENTTNISIHEKTGLVPNLFYINDEENIKMILSETNAVQKRTIFSSRGGHYICKYSLDNGKFTLLEYFLKKCLSSKEEAIRFKKEFMKFSVDEHWEENSDKWNRLDAVISQL